MVIIGSGKNHQWMVEIFSNYLLVNTKYKFVRYHLNEMAKVNIATLRTKQHGMLPQHSLSGIFAQKA